MQIYGIRMFNFCRFGETCNSIVFDVTPENISRLHNENDSLTMDTLYDELLKDPVSYVNGIKNNGITDLLAICGVKGDNYDRSNGVGKSSIFEAICYAHYDRIVRRSVNTDKIEKAGISVVTRFNGVYPSELRESYVEEIFEEKGKIYRIKRGRTFNESHKSHSPVVEFECINESNVDNDSQSSHRSGDTNDAIANITPWDYDVFVNGAMFGQNDAGKFLMGTDKIRKEMLINLLKLEDIVVACLERIRNRKNQKIKDNDNLVAQIDILNQNLKERESVEVLEDKIKSYKKISIEADNKILKISNDIETLSKSDEIKMVASIKEEGRKVKEDILSQEDQKKIQVKEWEDLYGDTTKKITSQETKIQILVNRRKAIVEDMAKKSQWVEKFDMATREADLKKVETARSQKSIYLNKVKIAQDSKEKLGESLATNKSNYDRLMREIASLNVQLKNASDKEEFICDKCKSKVSRSHIEEEISKNNKEAKTYSENIKNFLEGQKVIVKDLEEAQRRLEIINDWLIKEEKIKSEIKEYNDTKIAIESLKKQDSEDYEKNSNELKVELGALQIKSKDYKIKIDSVSQKYDSKIKELKGKIDEIAARYKESQKIAENIQKKIDEFKIQKNEISSSKATANSQIGSVTKEIETIKGDILKILKLTKELEDSQIVLNRLLILEDAFGLEGIQTRIVKKYLPLLNIYIKEFLDILSNGEMGVELFINSHSKVDIKITGGSADTYVMLSGGEKVLVKLAVDIGLALLSFSRCAQKPEIICLDEIFGQLDNFNIKAVFLLLQNLRGRFSRVMIISHEADINNNIPHKIFIEKEDGDFGRSKFRNIT